MRAAAALLADLHLAGDPRDTADLLAFFEAQRRDGGAEAIYLLGDLFDVWLGSPKLQLGFQEEVVRAIGRLTAEGIAVKLVEGNREFRIARTFGRLFTAASEDWLEEELAGLRLHLAHGDRVNTDDRLYRLWRRLSKNRLAFAFFDLLPRRAGLALALALERRLRTTNQAMRSYFPEAHCVRYAAPLVAAGVDLVVFGHFHLERTIPVEAGGRRGHVLCLPDWKRSRRYLRIERDGRWRVVGFDPAGLEAARPALAR
ncbi:MAG TPA: metallophosphoesterase [Thermodesulfobacteriota bacterium]|nr:metallophosphoesterase [Thermodesulfobacteriota bacterium]